MIKLKVWLNYHDLLTALKHLQKTWWKNKTIIDEKPCERKSRGFTPVIQTSVSDSIHSLSAFLKPCPCKIVATAMCKTWRRALGTSWSCFSIPDSLSRKYIVRRRRLKLTWTHNKSSASIRLHCCCYFASVCKGVNGRMSKQRLKIVSAHS